MRTPHSSTNKGKRVKITTRTGIVFVGKFREKKGDTIILEKPSVKVIWPPATSGFTSDQTSFQMKEVRAFSIYKPTCTQTK